jgi:ABC-type polysaccharide/polyol phosphate transport system ATPase subunit
MEKKILNNLTSDDNLAIKVSNLTKIYHLYDKPQDRLKEALNPFKKSYHHDFYAMENVSFEIKKNETVGIIGKNGAGKSTLLKMITGVLTPSSGSIEVNGKIASLLELGTGFNPDMTGHENIYLYGTLMGRSREEIDSTVNDILEFADIGEFIYQPVKTYSSGMAARLGFSVVINIEPEILIVDEVLSVGDISSMYFSITVVLLS